MHALSCLSSAKALAVSLLRRRFFCFSCTLMVAMSSPSGAAEPVKKPALKAAAIESGVTPVVGGATVGKTGAVVLNVAGPLKSTITLLDDGGERLCLVTTHFNSPKAVNVSAMFCREIARELNLPVERVLIFVSHNHTDMEGVLPWSRWALEMHQQGKADAVEKYPEVEMYAIRIGDVGIVGMPMRRAVPVEGAHIEDHVTIGGGVTICPDVAIGRGSFIAAGAVVNKDVPPNTLAMGVPARHYPLTEAMGSGNIPGMLLPQTDLFGSHHDDTWKSESFPTP